MILIDIGVQDGERKYNHYCYYETFSKDDHDKGKITERTILSEFFGLNLTDNDYFDNDKDSYWNDTSAVYINSVQDISSQELETLRKLEIVY